MPSPPPFRIVIYTSVEPDTTPEAAKYGAALFIGYEEVPRWTSSGPTAAAAREKMQAFWDKERKSHEPRQGPRRDRPAPGMDAEESAPPQPIDEDDGEVL